MLSILFTGKYGNMNFRIKIACTQQWKACVREGKKPVIEEIEMDRRNLGHGKN